MTDATLKPFSNGPNTNTKLTRPLGNRHGHSIHCVAHIGSPVVALGLLRCPLAIIWFVVSIIVFSVNAEPCSWAKSHISQEQIKGIFPPIANLNSSPSIKWVSGISSRVTPCDHSRPSLVLWRSSHSVCRVYFHGKASAGFDLASPERGSSEACSFPAITYAIPHLSTRAVLSVWT